mgnify:CR=1 FL=1
MIQQSITVVTKWMKKDKLLLIGSAVSAYGQWVYTECNWECEDSELNKLRSGRPLEQLPALMKEVEAWAENNGFKQTPV